MLPDAAFQDYDGNGYPILLAVKAPGQVAAQNVTGASVVRGARSGNANADPGSGRFAAGSKKNPGKNIVQSQNPLVVNRLGVPQGVTPEEWNRRLDAVRDAAREFDEMSQGDAKDFLKGRVNDLTKVDLQSFLSDVREQRIDDLIDVLDTQLRTKVDGAGRARRVVRLQAPRGFVKRVFASLNDDEVIKVVTRLANRGWDENVLVSNVISRINKEDRRKQLEDKFRATLGNVKLEDWGYGWRPDADGIELDFEDEPEQQAIHISMPEMPKSPTAIELAEALSVVAQKMPVPNVTVDAPVINVEAPKPVDKQVVRDSEGNLVGIKNAET